MFDIVIVGGGGFGREVYNWTKDSFPSNKFTIKGFLDPDKNILNGFNMSVGVIGDEDAYEISDRDRFIIAIGQINLKKKVIKRIKNKCGQFLTLIHPTAIVSNTTHIGEGVVICPFATVSDNVTLDDFVMMNYYSSCGHDSRVGKYSILSPYATVNGEAILEEEVFLGSHSTVRLSKRVGRKSKVSANSAVMQDVPERALVSGVPGVAKVIY